MLISERIFQYMKEKKISQIEFSQKTGISQSTISDWKRKGTNPSADKIMIICEVLDVSPYALLQGTDHQNRKEYRTTDSLVIERNSEEFQLFEIYQNLDPASRHRLEGYAHALKDLQ